MSEADLAREIATAILAIDTLGGGDVMDTSGAGRFIADSWFTEEPLSEAYAHPAAARMRATGGVAGRTPDRAAVDTYLAAIDVPHALAATAGAGRALGGLRGAYLAGLAASLEVMWDLAQEVLERG